VFACCMNSTINTPHLSQKTIAFSHLADKFVEAFSTCLVNACACTALTVLWFQHSQMKPITCYSYHVIEKFMAISVVLL
jgi:hypothetical protein